MRKIVKMQVHDRNFYEKQELFLCKAPKRYPCFCYKCGIAIALEFWYNELAELKKGYCFLPHEPAGKPGAKTAVFRTTCPAGDARADANLETREKA